MIGSELFDTTPILIKIRYIKTFVEFRMSPEKNRSSKGDNSYMTPIVPSLVLRDLHKGWNQSSPSSWSVSRLERSEPKPEVELLEKKSESSRVSRSLGSTEFLLDSFLDFCSLSSSFSFSLAAASCLELCTPWERNEFCSGTISNFWLISSKFY